MQMSLRSDKMVARLLSCETGMNWPRFVRLSSVHSFICLSVCCTRSLFQIALIGLRGVPQHMFVCRASLTPLIAVEGNSVSAGCIFSSLLSFFFGIDEHLGTRFLLTLHQMHWLFGGICCVFSVYSSCLVCGWRLLRLHVLRVLIYNRLLRCSLCVVLSFCQCGVGTGNLLR